MPWLKKGERYDRTYVTEAMLIHLLDGECTASEVEAHVANLDLQEGPSCDFLLRKLCKRGLVVYEYRDRGGEPERVVELTEAGRVEALRINEVWEKILNGE